jgi:hypothetical protein
MPVQLYPVQDAIICIYNSMKWQPEISMIKDRRNSSVNLPKFGITGKEKKSWNVFPLIFYYP